MKTLKLFFVLFLFFGSSYLILGQSPQPDSSPIQVIVQVPEAKPDIKSWFSLVAQYLALVVTLVLFYLNYQLLKEMRQISSKSKDISDQSRIISEKSKQLNYNSKQIDVIRMFNDKISALIDIEAEKMTDNLFLEKFWGIQYEQYFWWRKGLIHNDFFAVWMIVRHSNFHEGFQSFFRHFEPEQYKKSFADQESKYGKFRESGKFFKFFNNLHNIQPETKKTVEQKIIEMIHNTKKEKLLFQDDEKVVAPRIAPEDTSRESQET